MDTISRINRLRAYYNWLPVSATGQSVSELLDALDRRAKLDTTGGLAGERMWNGFHPYPNQVGRRIRLHEAAISPARCGTCRHMSPTKRDVVPAPRHHFWLGADE